MGDLARLLNLPSDSTREIECRACYGMGYVPGKTMMVEKCPICLGTGRIEVVKSDRPVTDPTEGDADA